MIAVLSIAPQIKHAFTRGYSHILVRSFVGEIGTATLAERFSATYALISATV
jgi:hypothetical protein